MFRLLSSQTVDTIFFYIFVLLVLAGIAVYFYKYHHNLINKRNIQVLLSLCVVSIILILFVNYFKENPPGNIYYTKFKDAGNLKIGSIVIYRGVNVGKVLNISITPDSKYALVEFIITDENAQIPKKSHTELSFSSFSDKQPLFIKPPKGEKDYNFLAYGEHLESDESKTFEEMELLLGRLIREGKIEKIVDNINHLVKNTSDITKSFEYTLQETAELVKSVKKTNENINQVLQNGNIAGDVKTVVNNANTTVKKFEKVAEKTDNVINKSSTVLKSIQTTVDKVDSHLNDEGLNEDLRVSAHTLRDVLEDVQEITQDDTIKGHLKNSISKTSEFSSNATCLTKGLNSMLGKRFLIPRLILGKPGKELDECSQDKVLELENIKNNKQENNADKNE